MSATTDEATVRPLTPQSSKKRKLISETPEKSAKKKRKHEKVGADILASQESTSSKKDKKKKKRDKLDSTVETIPETQESQDVELPDAPEENGSPAIEQVAADELSVDIDTTAPMDDVAEQDDELFSSDEPSCFYEKRLSLQVSIPAISLDTTTSSILSLRLGPLLLTYFPPAEGIVLSFSDPVLLADPSHGVNLPLQAPKSGQIPRYPPGETFAQCADAFGVCWVWLTVTFLVFKPQSGDTLKGWTNVSSEGFVGLVSYNYFQTAVGKSRIPESWIWDGPTREGNKTKKKTRKERLRDEGDLTTSQETVNGHDIPQNEETAQNGTNSFTDSNGVAVSATQKFRVVDIEMVPGHEKDRWTLQIEGSLLSPDEEAAVIAEERRRFEQAQNRRARSKTPGSEAGDAPFMSGALPFIQEGIQASSP